MAPQPAVHPDSETARLAVLRQYQILDTPPEDEFDDLTKLAAHICETPTALLTLVDSERQWFKSRIGFNAAATARQLSFCAHAMVQPDVLVIPDTTRDPTFGGHPSVQGEPFVRFYAGAPLVSPEGQPLGALCVMDRQPHAFHESHKQVLRALARHAMARLELRRLRPRPGGPAEPMPAAGSNGDVLESTADAFFALDAAGRITYVNARAAFLLRRGPSDLRGRILWTEARDCVGDEQFDACRRALEEGKPATVDCFYPALDRWLENRIYPTPAGTAIFLRDVTDRKRNEALVAGQNRLLELIARGEPLGRALAALVTFLETQSPDMLCSVLLLDEAGTRVRTGAAPSLPIEFTAAIDGQPIGPSAGSCGTAAYRREAVFVEDIAIDPLWNSYRTLTLAHGLRACWSTPIFDSGHRVLGTFAIYYRRPAKPTPWHLRLIEVATHIASVAISWDRAQSVLRRSEERYRTTLDNILEGCQLIGFDWRYLYLNDAAARHNRRPNHQLLGRTMMEAWPGIEGTPVFAMLRRCMTERIPLHEEIEFVFADGTRGWYDVRSQPVPEGIFALSIDITQRKEADAAVRESEARLREAQRDARIGSWRYVAGGPFTWSDQLFELFQLPRDQVPTYDAAMGRVHPEDRARPIFPQTALASGAPTFQTEFRILRPDGVEVTAFSRGRINRDRNAQLIDAVGTIQDITDRKAAEQALEQSHAAMRDLAERLEGVREEQSMHLAREIHDVLGQQLTGIKLELAWLKRRTRSVSDDPLRTSLERKLAETSELVDTTIDSVQKIARELRPGALDKLGLWTALDIELREFADRAGVTGRCKFPSDLPRPPERVETGVFRIVQEALTNIARHAQAAEVTLAAERANGGVRLDVRDNGRGFAGPASERHSLGLLGMRERARLFGGSIDIQSELGAGTIVRVFIPLPE